MDRMILALCKLGLFPFLILALLPFRVIAQGQAKQGPTLVGFYDVESVTKLDTEARVTVRLLLVNTSDVDLTDTIMTLRGPFPVAETSASFAPVSVGARGTVRLSEKFTMPLLEYKLVQMRVPLNLVIEFRDDSGKRTRQMTKLTYRLLPR